MSGLGHHVKVGQRLLRPQWEVRVHAWTPSLQKCSRKFEALVLGRRVGGGGGGEGGGLVLIGPTRAYLEVWGAHPLSHPVNRKAGKP